MTEEIKEILNKLLEYFKESNINDFGYEKDKLISYEEAQILLNYITNLQKENEKLKARYENLKKEHIDTISRNEDYRKRIDKAVEYINENWGHWCSNHCKYATETINILEGDE